MSEVLEDPLWPDFLALVSIIDNDRSDNGKSVNWKMKSKTMGVLLISTTKQQNLQESEEAKSLEESC